MERRHDWADQMYKMIDAHKDSVFEWGVDDCCLFITRVIDAMTGSELELRLKQEYDDEQSGKRFIIACGGMTEAVSRFLGAPSDERAMRGDAVLFDVGDGESVGIWDGRTIVGLAQNGLDQLPRESIIKVWKI